MREVNYFFKAGLFVAVAALSMGNESCDKEEVKEEQEIIKPHGGRVLKKRASIGQILTRTMNIESGEQFDFAFVANMQLYNLLDDSERYVIPRMERTTTYGAMVSSNDFEVYSNWLEEADIVVPMESSREAECLVYSPQVEVKGSIRSFELKSKEGIKFGLGPDSELGFLPSIDISMESASLNLGLEAIDALTGYQLAAGEASSEQTKTNLNLNINFGYFHLGPQYYFESPLADVTHRALVRTMNELNAKLDKEPWTSRVIENHDTHLVILGGSRSGIRVGDRFEIYNEIHYWKDEPCESKYLGATPTTPEPVAIIEISHLGNDIAQGRVIEQTLREPTLGAKVQWIKVNN